MHQTGPVMAANISIGSSTQRARTFTGIGHVQLGGGHQDADVHVGPGDAAMVSQHR